jgi:prolyl 4-hydroxylase
MNQKKHITNPIDSFLMIKRTTEDIDLVKSRIIKVIDRFADSIHELKPTGMDLAGSVEGIMRLQSIYHFKTADIINGIIDGDKTNDKLKPHDLFTIAREALKFGDKAFFVDEYLHHLRESIEKGEDEFGDVDQEEVEKIVIAQQNATKIDPYDETFVKDEIYQLREEQIIYSRACRQKLIKTPEEQKNLKCRYVSNSAFSKIGPFKMIEADHHSELVVFLDVLSDSEIETLKEISRARFNRAGVYTKDDANTLTSSRVSQISWFTDDAHELIAKISRRVEDMTGLTTNTAEQLQTQNYGIGGHYNLHWDHV